MFCPKCESEYRDGIARCAQCDVELVEPEVIELHHDGEPLVAVTNTTEPATLAIVRGLLESAGIPVVVQGEAGVALFPLGRAGGRVTKRLTGAVLLVPESLLDEAVALLNATPEEMPEFADESDEED